MTLLAHHLPNNDTETFYIFMKALGLRLADSQLGHWVNLAIEVNPLCGLLDTSPSVGPAPASFSTSGWQISPPCLTHEPLPSNSFPEFLSLPGNPAYLLLPSYWLIGSLLNQSESGKECLQNPETGDAS